MSNGKKREDLSPEIKIAPENTIKKVIPETRAKNSYLVISDKKGNIKKIPAKDL